MVAGRSIGIAYRRYRYSNSWCVKCMGRDGTIVIVIVIVIGNNNNNNNNNNFE